MRLLFGVLASFLTAVVFSHEGPLTTKALDALPEGYVGSAYQARTCSDFASAMNVAHQYNQGKDGAAEFLFRQYEKEGTCSIDSFFMIVVGKNLLCGAKVHIVELRIGESTRYYLTRAGWSPKEGSKDDQCQSTLSN